MTQQTPYQLLGEDGIRKLAHAFYDVMDELPQAATVRAMHAESLVDIKEKLYEYLLGWMGGPPLYAEKTGTVCLTEPHRPYAIGPAERDQWLLCMEGALDRTKASEELRDLLKEPLFRIADTVRNQDDSSPKIIDPNVIAMS